MIQLTAAEAKLPASLQQEFAAFLKAVPRLSTAINHHEGQSTRKRKKTPGNQAAQRISVSLVTDATMKKMNATYRRKAVTTDVLSFAYAEAGTPVYPGELAGEVVISYPQARRQAKQCGHRLRDELAVLTVHGVLHIIGYDHEKSIAAGHRMQQAENRILAEVGLESGLVGR